ncbi:MAG: ABC transporter substrate-binding protein [Candidatus Gracilibacteria bacterium]
MSNLGSKTITTFQIISLIFLTSCQVPFFGDKQNNSTGAVTIAYAEPISSYSPLNYGATNRKYLSNIYESLVRFDSTFNTESSLAVSWGRPDDLTWEFHLRDGVLFQDGSAFDAKDAIYSINLARSEYKSDLSALLSNISSVEEIDASRIKIATIHPDPLLLNRLTYVYMLPKDYTSFDVPVGTGAYRAKTFTENTLTLERFPDYWGPLPYFETANLIYIASPNERVSAMIKGQVDMLANVPPQEVDTLKNAGITVEEFPSLEVSFLMLNTGGILADESLRKSVGLAIDTDYATLLGGGYLEETSQYSATGIFGYVKGSKEREQNIDLAKTYRANIEGNVDITLDVPEGLSSLAEAIQNDLAKIDINVTVNVLESVDLENKILLGASDAYFFGWKYDLADLSDFFESVVHTRTGSYGSFNGISYSNTDVDQKIEESISVDSLAERSSLLNQISEEVLAENIIIPLFESKNLYAVSKDLVWPVRLDGQIWASDIFKNMVE